jgi:FixJ family two-component response regulator
MQPRERLTDKEMQVAALVWEGQSNREIASVIGTTEQVVKNFCATLSTNWECGAASNWRSTSRVMATTVGGMKSPWP